MSPFSFKRNYSRPFCYKKKVRPKTNTGNMMAWKLRPNLLLPDQKKKKAKLELASEFIRSKCFSMKWLENVWKVEKLPLINKYQTRHKKILFQNFPPTFSSRKMIKISLSFAPINKLISPIINKWKSPHVFPTSISEKFPYVVPLNISGDFICILPSLQVTCFY